MENTPAISLSTPNRRAGETIHHNLRADQQLVFVAGLHRSGTSLLYKLLGSDRHISIFQNTGVIEDEGQFLQDVFPLDSAYGGPGLFALNPEAHLTEKSTITDRARERLLRSWIPYWEVDKQVLVEKSPANLVRARFLQNIFPEAKFVFLMRHPIAVSMATSKWSGAYMRHLIRHWVTAHKIMNDDRKHLKHSVVIRYEDLLMEPEATRSRLSGLLGLELVLEWPRLRRNVNEEYFRKWQRGEHRLYQKPAGPFRTAKRLRNQLERLWITSKYEAVVKEFGYSFKSAEIN